MIGVILSIGIWLFGRRYYTYIWLALIAIWLYTIITGMRPPIIRGAIMGSMFLIAEFLGRQRNASTALALAAAVMVGIKPQILWDASFQLSFLAMSGLVILFPYFQSYGKKGLHIDMRSEGILASWYNIAIDSLAVTLAAILATMPVIAYYFGLVSMVGIPATFFALPALPGIIITAAMVSIAGLFTPFLAQILGWITWLFISYLILVVQIFDALPYSFAEPGNIQLWQVWCYYSLLSAATMAFIYRTRLSNFISWTALKLRRAIDQASESSIRLPRKWIIPPLLITAILVWTAVLNMPDGKLHVSVLDVGQGDAILIQTPNSQNILIDGGPSPLAINLELSKKLPFWDRSIDLIVLTQPQADHITGLIETVQRYNVKQIIAPGVTSDSVTYNHWLKLVNDKEIEYKTAHAAQELALGNGIKIEVLHPPPTLLQGTSDDIDNNGLVLRLTWSDISFLFTGDINKEAELHLISHRANLKSTVLKVAHHGSKTSTSSQFLAVVDPKAAVISAGEDNRFGHPHPEIVSKLKERTGITNLFITCESSTVEFITDGDRLWVKTDR